MRGRPSFQPRGASMGNPAGRFSAGSPHFRFGIGFGSGFGRTFFHERWHHHHRFFGGAWGYGSYGYPAWGYAYYGYPWFADHSYFMERPYYASNIDAAVDGEQTRMEERLGRIQDRLDGLLERLESVHPLPAQTRPQPEPERSSAATLVFRDGHTEQIQNYAVVGHTLWIFTEDRARKIPLSDINAEATDKANEQQGVDLYLPHK
jgi:hypothetical protein